MPEPPSEQAVLNYLDWQDVYANEKPFQLFSVVSNCGLAGERTTNLVFKEGPVEFIRDVRGEESLYSLDAQGFAFRVYPTCLRDFSVREHIENDYLSEMEELLKREVESVDKVFFFDWRVCSLIKTSVEYMLKGGQIRKNIEITGRAAIDANDKMQYLLPAKHAHIGE